MARCSLGKTQRKRRSETLDCVPAAISSKKLKGNANVEEEEVLSPASLVKKLDTIAPLVMQDTSEAVAVELKGFEEVGLTTEEFERKREEVRQHTLHPESFDSCGRTELKTTDAVIAGAMLFVDESRTTRSMLKKLKDNCGIPEAEVLYKPLSEYGKEFKTAQAMREARQATVVESLVDLKKQIQFKTDVLKNLSDSTNSRKKCSSRVPRENFVMKTPKKRLELNPLDCNRIIQQYALEVASLVHDKSCKRRNSAPIPFNLDDDEE